MKSLISKNCLKKKEEEERRTKQSLDSPQTIEVNKNDFSNIVFSLVKFFLDYEETDLLFSG